MNTRWTTMAFLGALLAGCGGVVDMAPVTETLALQATTDKTPPVQAATAPASAGQAPTLGTAEPADAGARTRAGRYATAAQADALEAELGYAAIRVDVGCCDPGAADMAVLMAYVSQAAYDLPNSAPVLVRGSDLRMAAAVANRLADAGMTRVWLVLP